MRQIIVTVHFLSFLHRALMPKERRVMPMLPRSLERMVNKVRTSSETFSTQRTDLTSKLTSSVVMLGCVSSEGSSADSDAVQTVEAVPQSQRPLTASMKPSPESSALTDSVQSNVETSSAPGQLVHVLQVTLYVFVMLYIQRWRQCS